MYKDRLHKFIGGTLMLILFFFVAACTPQHSQEVDELNDKAYVSHYRNLDSVRYYAKKALALSDGYSAGKAEALNNLVFCDLMRMDFSKAYERLEEVLNSTDNQVELLIADVQFMRLCQRESRNKEFYDYYEKAVWRLRRIQEDERLLSERMKRRMVYARSEFYIVTSIYYFYVGLEQPSINALKNINPDGEIQTDIGQFLSYLYNVGAGGIITNGTQEEINQREFDYLIRCYMLSRQHNYPYWEANSLQGLSEHLQNKASRDILIEHNLPSIQYINIDHMPDSLLAGNLAQRSLDLFQKYGDVYQIAGSYRTLASCYWHIHDYPSALICLQNALRKNRAIEQAPDLVASIREQLSVVYSSMNDKQASDFNRNAYLDLQEQTRQDRYFESRAGQLEQTSKQLNLMIMAIGLAIVFIIFLLLVLHYLRRRNDSRKSLDDLLVPLEQWKRDNEQYMAQLEDEYDEVSEQLTISKLHLVDNKRKNLEQRAKVTLVNNVTPFIDRMLHEINKLKKGGENAAIQQERYTYIQELTDKIDELNTVLTEWIQLRQGRLSLHIESFPLQNIFDIVKKGRMGFAMKGVKLRVDNTRAVVKADQVLTLFMVNTLADNARKFTEAGGEVTISSTEEPDYVEISVSDTGCGLSQDQQENIFDHKIILDLPENTSHGFGLMNCNGIINKYKKISQIFSVCTIGVDSKLGVGSRFFFRLPKGISRLLLVVLLSVSSLLSYGARPTHNTDKAKALAKHDYIGLAGIYADSTYFCNINGDYALALAYADSCRNYLNKEYLRLHPHGKLLLEKIGSLSNVPAEIKWYHDSIPMNYDIILDLRNESAIAALALHKWDLYKYNNSVFTHLFKEKSADNTLAAYCRMMMKSETNKNVAIVLLVLLLLLILPVYYLMYYRRRLSYQFSVEQVKRINTVLLSNVSVEEKLRSVESVDSGRFPERLKNIISQIQETLFEANEKNQKSQSNIELLEDEARCVEYENERLHISNSILDNCLSTLKHETMYYPSRIRQLVDQREKQLETIDELAVYYKELYSILSQQAMHQVENTKLVAHPVILADLVSANKFITPETPVPAILGDPDLLVYMFDILFLKNDNQPLIVTSEEKKGGYIILHVLMSALRLTDEACRNLFSPSAENLMFYICRQIARDNGEATNKRGCGISASRTEDGTVIDIVLSKAK